MVRIIRLIMVISTHTMAFIIVVFIGTCRAVWVPRQDWLHRIWCTIAESVFCHYTVCYMYVCACISTHMLYRESSRPVLNGEYAWFAGQCLGMLRLAGPYVGIRTKNFNLVHQVRDRYSLYACSQHFQKFMCKQLINDKWMHMTPLCIASALHAFWTVSNPLSS